MSGDACSWAHTNGLVSWPKSLHRESSANWMHRTPAGLPKGMPGMGELMDGAVQQAPQPLRQEKVMHRC